MEREQIIRVVSDAAVGIAALWFVKQLGFKGGSVVAGLAVAAAHEMFDTPLAKVIEENTRFA